MVVSSLFYLFSSSVLPSKPPPPPLSPPTLHSLPSQLHFSRTSGWVPLVATDSDDLLSVMCPSLAYSNTLNFKSGFNVQIKVDDNEPEDRIVMRFKKAVIKAGVLQECKRRKFFENSQEKKKRKRREAAKRNRRRPKPRVQATPAAPKKNDDTDDNDNWELPDGDIPYCTGLPEE